MNEQLQREGGLWCGGGGWQVKGSSFSCSDAAIVRLQLCAPTFRRLGIKPQHIWICTKYHRFQVVFEALVWPQNKCEQVWSQIGENREWSYTWPWRSEEKLPSGTETGEKWGFCGKLHSSFLVSFTKPILWGSFNRRFWQKFVRPNFLNFLFFPVYVFLYLCLPVGVYTYMCNCVLCIVYVYAFSIEFTTRWALHIVYLQLVAG